MKISAFPRKLPAVLVICTLGATASHAFAQGKGKAQAKGSPKIETQENHGRGAGELPHGLETLSEKKGELPSGLQRKRDDGSLARGLQEGGKRLSDGGKVKKRAK